MASEPKLAFFGHHPDASTDFCIEVESIEAMAHNACIFLEDGFTKYGSEKEFWGHLMRALRWANKTDVADDYVIRARDDLRTFERRFFAGEFDPRPAQ